MPEPTRKSDVWQGALWINSEQIISVDVLIQLSPYDSETFDVISRDAAYHAV